FIRLISEQTVHVNAGRLRTFPGGYDYYLQKTHAETARAGLTGGAKAVTHNPAKSAPVSKGDQRTRKRAEAEARNAKSRNRRGIKNEVQRLEKEIQKAEAQITKLTVDLEDPETYENPNRAMTINRDLTQAQTTLDNLTPEWEKAAAKLEAM
ncbi:MAG: ABC transporter ATP-binding protein, partial [Verrucomicrobiota bacterium]|nr:ABC transporter ATP-binding protein [Verrucomicrobiota bacterium]